MIVVDTSALVAILRHEPERDAFLTFLLSEDGPRISAASVLECSIVLRSFKAAPDIEVEASLDRFVEDAKLNIEPVDQSILRLAREAHRRYGKGVGHPAQLNFGDCFSYALAKSLNAPLLYKGGDFAKTDITSAL